MFAAFCLFYYPSATSFLASADKFISIHSVFSTSKALLEMKQDESFHQVLLNV